MNVITISEVKMKLYIVLCLQAIIINTAWSLPLLQNNPFLSNNIGSNNLAPTCASNHFPNFGLNNMANQFANEANVISNNLASRNSILANANTAIINEEVLPATITSANFIPIENLPSELASSLQMAPVISEIVPSLQYGDITMAGDLPIGGTIKVCGCFPVYGTISVDGNLPSAGTAVVAESFGNQIADVISQCANQVIL